MPWVSNNWISPYKASFIFVFEKKKISRFYKLSFHYVRVYSYKAYILIKLKNDAQYQHKCQKLDIKAYISFLIGYKLTNIYWIKIFIKKKVVFIRDGIFDKDII